MDEDDLIKDAVRQAVVAWFDGDAPVLDGGMLAVLRALDELKGVVGDDDGVRRVVWIDELEERAASLSGGVYGMVEKWACSRGYTDGTPDAVSPS